MSKMEKALLALDVADAVTGVVADAVEAATASPANAPTPHAKNLSALVGAGKLPLDMLPKAANAYAIHKIAKAKKAAIALAVANGATITPATGVDPSPIPMEGAIVLPSPASGGRSLVLIGGFPLPAFPTLPKALSAGMKVFRR
jgi:hypothetical protein